MNHTFIQRCATVNRINFASPFDFNEDQKALFVSGGKVLAGQSNTVNKRRRLCKKAAPFPL
jgi:hypothetical protein